MATSCAQSGNEIASSFGVWSHRDLASKASEEHPVKEDEMTELFQELMDRIYNADPVEFDSRDWYY